MTPAYIDLYAPEICIKTVYDKHYLNVQKTSHYCNLNFKNKLLTKAIFTEEYMKNLIRIQIIILFFVMTFSSFLYQSTSSQSQKLQNDPRYEIVLKVNSEVFKLPEGLKEITVGENEQLKRKMDVISSAIDSVLGKYQVNKIRKAYPDFKQSDRIKTTRNGKVVKFRDKSDIHILTVIRLEDAEKLIAELSKIPGVVYAETNFANIKADIDIVSPNDEFFSQQWNLHNDGSGGKTYDADIDAPEAWYITTGSSIIMIGIIDNGIRITHEDLFWRVSGDTYNDTGYLGHGTMVAGVAAATGNNGTGIAGVDWNVRTYSSAIRYGSGGSSNTEIAEKIDEAISAGSDIINNSWTAGDPSYTLLSAFADAYLNNVVIVACMGNDYGNVLRFPAGYGGVIAVGATDSTDNKADFSNTGNNIDVVAPGVNIHTLDCTSDESYACVSGTSVAAPHVSGIASLILSVNPNLYNDDVENIIKISADKVDGMSQQNFTTDYGYGRVNAYKALQYLQPPYILERGIASGFDQQTLISNNYDFMVL